MPTYQYACTNPDCDHRFEQFQSFTDAALTECPVCSGRLRKVYGSVGVVFKGSGFYRNDSRAEANGAKKKVSETSSGASSDSSSSSDSSDSSSGGTDSSGKDSGSKDSGGKDSGSKDTSSGSRDASRPGASASSSSSGKADSSRGDSSSKARAS